jgi:hypothetical protein
MAWLALIFAGLFEIGWAVGLKFTEGFTRFWPTLGTVTSMTVSLGLLGDGVAKPAARHRLCHLDRCGDGRHCPARHGTVP